MKTRALAFDTVTSPLACHHSAWFNAIPVRHSRRQFDSRPCDTATLDTLGETCVSLSTCSEARVILEPAPDGDMFSGILGSYGKVTGAPHVLIIVAADSSTAAQAHAGYVGEAAVLEATALGLDTCWVGGFFRHKVVRRHVMLRGEERVVAVSPVGYATAHDGPSERSLRRLSRSRSRLPLTRIAPGLDESWPTWAYAAVEAARWAPSAMNRQPWRFRMEDDCLTVARDARREAPRVSRALDCGIAMLHAELGAMSRGVSGAWMDLGAHLDVARFVPGSEQA